MHEAGPVVVLFAHPDDEIAVFPWLRAAREAGALIDCVWLTDGGWGGQDVERRCRESRGVLAGMGLDPGSLHFAGIELGIGDGELHLQVERAIDWVLQRFAATGVTTRLWIPAWEGGHPDHDATHLVGHALARHLGVGPVQFSLYQGRGLPGPWFRVLAPIPENGPSEAITVGALERIRCVVRCLAYRSQWKSFAGLLPFYALRMLVRDPFVMQRARFERTAERPHPGPLLYERRGGPSWHDFAQATASHRALR